MPESEFEPLYFWRSNAGRYEYIEYEAHKAWKRKMGELHPDRPGTQAGDRKHCTDLTVAYQRVKHLLRRKPRLGIHTQGI